MSFLILSSKYFIQKQDFITTLPLCSLVQTQQSIANPHWSLLPPHARYLG